METEWIRQRSWLDEVKKRSTTAKVTKDKSVSTTTTGLGPGASWLAIQVPHYIDDVAVKHCRSAARVARAATNGHGAGSSVYYALPDIPLLARDSAGRPIFSVILMLSRAPAIYEESIYDLIQQSIVSFDLSLQLSGNGLNALSTSAELRGDNGQVEVRPLFAREARFKLLANEGNANHVIATAVSNGGTSIRASLEATLNREQTLGLLAALDGGVSNLTLSAAVTYRVSGVTTCRVAGEWLAIYDFIAQRINPAESLTRQHVRSLFDQMVQVGVLVTSGAVQAGSTSLFDAFIRQSIVILNRLTKDLVSTDPGNLYALRARPNAGFQFQHEEEVSGDSLETITIEGPIETAINGLLDGLNRDAFIRLVSIGGAIGPAPRPQRFVGANDRANPTGRARQRNEKIELAVNDGELESVALKLRPQGASPSSGPNAHAMIASGVAKLLGGSAVAPDKFDLSLNDWRLEKKQPRHLPIVNDPAAPIWPDRIDSNRFWYAPAFELLKPEPDANPGTAPFEFTFRRIGESESGPALAAQIRFTLRSGMSRETHEALRARGNPPASPVAMNNLAVSLVLPFINSTTNELTRHTCPCKLSVEGDNVIAIVDDLATQWVRLAYTVLSKSDAPNPPLISVAFTYEAYSWMPHLAKLTFGNKEALIPVVFSAEQLQRIEGVTYFDATTSTLHFDHSTTHVVNFNSSRNARRRPAGEVEPEDPPEEEEPAEQEEPPPRPKKVSIVRPTLRLLEITEIVQQGSLARQTLVRQQQHDAKFPCNVLGEFYREITDHGEEGIGCRPALELGQIPYRQYERVPQLDAIVNGETIFQVYRSLPNPGRFLVLPARYLITRHSPGTPHAYKPRILMYADEDPTHALKTPIIITADLQPDINPHLRRDLELKLARLAAEPLIDYPTEIAAATAFEFLALDSTPVSAIRTVDSISVTIGATSADITLLETRLQTGGVTGGVKFILDDGTELASTLLLDLRYFSGPWQGGAVTAERSGNGVLLKNQIDRPVSVHDLMIVSDAASRLVPVEQMISAGASKTIAVDALTNQAELYPVYTAQPVAEALKRVPNAIERVHINVLFTNEITFSAHNLTALTLFVRLEGSSHAEQLHVTADITLVQADLLLPLTEYISDPVIQLRIVKKFSDGRNETKDWFNWDLNADGFVVPLDWDLVQ